MLIITIKQGKERSLLVKVAAATLSLREAEVLRVFGREAMPLLARRYPAFYAMLSLLKLRLSW
jgi:hypothetical protein